MKNTLLVLALGCALAGFNSGCGSGSGTVPLAPGAEQTVSRRAYRGLEVTLSTPKNRYAVGENIPVKITVANITDKPIRVQGYGMPDIASSILSMNGKPFDGNGSATGEEGFVTLAAGKTRQYSVVHVPNKPGRAPFSVGTYLIHGWINASYLDEVPVPREEISPLFGTQATAVTAPPLQIRIVPE